MALKSKTYPPVHWVKGHRLQMGELSDPSCSWCWTRESKIKGFCPDVAPHFFKKLLSGLGTFVFITIWNSIVAMVLVLIAWLIALILGGDSAAFWTASNADILPPGVPIWVGWLVMVNIIGWLEYAK